MFFFLKILQSTTVAATENGVVQLVLYFVVFFLIRVFFFSFFCFFFGAVQQNKQKKRRDGSAVDDRVHSDAMRNAARHVRSHPVIRLDAFPFWLTHRNCEKKHKKKTIKTKKEKQIRRCRSPLKRKRNRTIAREATTNLHLICISLPGEGVGATSSARCSFLLFVCFFWGGGKFFFIFCLFPSFPFDPLSQQQQQQKP